MKLADIQATYDETGKPKTAASEIHLCRILSTLKTGDNYAVVRVSFWDYDPDQKKTIFSEQKVTFWDNETEKNAIKVKAAEPGAYIVAQIGTRKNGEKVCIRFVEKNQKLTVGSGQDEINILFGRANKPEIGQKDIKGQSVKCLTMIIPIKTPEGKAVKFTVDMLESQKKARVDRAYKIVTENTLVALVCGRAFKDSYSAFKVSYPMEQPAQQREAEITPKDEAPAQNGTQASNDPGDTILVIGAIGEKLKLSVKDTYKDHKEWVEFIAWEWEPWSTDMSKLEAQKAQKQACRDYLDKLGVQPPKKL